MSLPSDRPTTAPTRHARRLAALAAACLALGTGQALAQQPPIDDGFTHPLDRLEFNAGLDQQVFEQATFEALDVYDPLETVNRHIYHFNYQLDQWVMLPVVRGYQYVTPRFVRRGVSNFFENLGDVPNLVNSVLQLKPKRAMQTTARLLFNTVLGVGGLWDPATRMGLPRQPEDFGQTLGYWGVPPGPYLVIPALGPSNLRDATGLLTDNAIRQEINFLNYADASSDYWALPVLRAIDTRYTTPFRYGQLNSPFEYSKVRYVYTRARQLQVEE